RARGGRCAGGPSAGAQGRSGGDHLRRRGRGGDADRPVAPPGATRAAHAPPLPGRVRRGLPGLRQAADRLALSRDRTLNVRTDPNATDSTRAITANAIGIATTPWPPTSSAINTPRPAICTEFVTSGVRVSRSAMRER